MLPEHPRPALLPWLSSIASADGIHAHVFDMSVSL